LGIQNERRFQLFEVRDKMKKTVADTLSAPQADQETPMAETVYITSGNTAVFRCPNCQRTKTVDVSAFTERSQPLRFKVKCPCGHVTVSTLEKRRRFRKDTDFPGSYVHYVNGQPKGKGSLRVKDLSTTGMKLLIAASETFAPGDMLKVSFSLDDAQGTRVQKKVIVRNIAPHHVGTEFAPTETIDTALGFYLRS
jgi:hypothetical protein